MGRHALENAAALGKLVEELSRAGPATGGLDPMNLSRRLIVKPGKKLRLSDRDPDDMAGLGKPRGREATEKNLRRLADLEYLLYAEHKRALLVVLQGMDAAGKDGTIRRVMTGLNPQSCKVTSFKEPSAEELAHDFLWRIHKAVPSYGDIGIFNRSHYEDALVVRVHGLVPESVWSRRYDEINAFEKNLAEGGVMVLKFFLHISKDEQKRRFEDRLGDPTKNWKASPADFKERQFWRDYTKAYEDVLAKCSTPWAPWFVIPANHKWFRDLAVSQIIVETLEGMDLRFPKPAFDLSKIVIE